MNIRSHRDTGDKMTELHIHGRKASSVFDLLGTNENDITYSVAWALSRCPVFLRSFLANTINWKDEVSEAIVRLQTYEKNDDSIGITDMEVESPGKFFVIIEAKKGWELPTTDQLSKYAQRPSFVSSTAPIKKLIVCSECSRDYANIHLRRYVSGVNVSHLSWNEIAGLAQSSLSDSSHTEKQLLRELITYLGGLRMQNIDSNRVYVVSLGQGKPKGWTITWIDIVEKYSMYFHPVGGKGGWPKEPPNYVAFRYDGKLQSIHHIEDYEVVTNMHTRIPGAADEEWPPHFLYKLGPAFKPAHEVRTGSRIKKAARVWCMLDTLFTCETISDALTLTQKRIASQTW
jgi:hypothetical protein